MKDDCQFCLGAKGNVRGNENVIGGVVCCDDCSVLVTDATKRLTAAHQKRLDEVRRLKALLPDEREREALRVLADILLDDSGTARIDRAALELQAAWDLVYRLLAASHSEGTP